MQNGKNIYAVLDVWENEPNFDLELFKLIEIGTPHIAGYSLEGKVNGTMLIFNKIISYLKREDKWNIALPNILDNRIKLTGYEINLELLTTLFAKSYKIKDDDILLRKSFSLSENEKNNLFDKLRKCYKPRRELNNFEVKLNNKNESLQKILAVLRIKVK